MGSPLRREVEYLSRCDGFVCHFLDSRYRICGLLEYIEERCPGGIRSRLLRDKCSDLGGHDLADVVYLDVSLITISSRWRATYQSITHTLEISEAERGRFPRRFPRQDSPFAAGDPRPFSTSAHARDSVPTPTSLTLPLRTLLMSPSLISPSLCASWIGPRILDCLQ